jgi:tetrahydromethanopterin S-methyltransferase subunit F
MPLLFDTVASRFAGFRIGPAFLSSERLRAEERAIEAALRETLRFRSGPVGRNKQLWSGSGGGLQGRGPLSGRKGLAPKA